MGDDEASPYIQFRIDVSKKEEWLEYVEDPESEYATLTDLIKTAVNNTISSEWVLEQPGDDSLSDDVTDSLSNIDERLDALETQLDDVALGAADDEEDDISESELRRLAVEVHKSLPVVQDSDHLIDVESVMTINPGERASVTGTAQDLSSIIDEDESKTRRALIYLERQETANVESTIHDGTRRWFEVDPTVDRHPPSTEEIADKVSEDELEFISGDKLRSEE